MRWQFGRRSDNVEDKRGSGGGGVMIGGGIGTIILAVVALFLGVDPSVVLQRTLNDVQVNPSSEINSPQQQEAAEFTSTVLAYTEDTWHQIFKENGGQYREPKLVLYSGSVDSACGYAQSAVGPFYCPADQKVYIDLSFYEDLKRRHNAPGDFAQAYVIAHEIGHHVQKLLGISDQVHQMQRKVNKTEANHLSVMLELQADCFAGVWANRTEESQNILEQGDVEEAINAASQIGDDRLQRQAQGYVVPDSFTHGTSKQRMKWFSKGLQTGDIKKCDTFSEL